MVVSIEDLPTQVDNNKVETNIGSGKRFDSDASKLIAALTTREALWPFSFPLTEGEAACMDQIASQVILFTCAAALFPFIKSIKSYETQKEEIKTVLFLQQMAPT